MTTTTERPPEAASSPPARAARAGQGRAPRRSFLWRFRRLFFLFGLLLVAALSGVGFVLSQVELPDPTFQPETTFVLDAGGNSLAELHGGEDRVERPLDAMPDVLIDAVLAAEDRDFFEHQGIDGSALARALWADIRAQGVAQGGSTITQQYVKNAYVGTERSLFRKIKEAVIAVKLERKVDKDEILERYLNAIYLGRGAYGVEAASQAYFDMSVGALDLRQSAYLAGLIRAPEAADASRDPAEADRRRDIVLAAMEREGYIDADEAADARREPVAMYVTQRPDQREEEIERRDIGTAYFVDFVRAQLIERFGEAAVYGGGLRVYTTLDLGMQQSAYEAVYADTLNRPDDPAGALVAVDDQGLVRAMVGGRNDGSSKVNLAVGAAGGGGGRQAGSAFKPFVLATAVTEGISVESAFQSPSRIVLPDADNGADYPVTNYERASHGRVNLIDATRLSSNTVYAQLIERVGPEDVVSTANRLGITAPLPPVVSLTLGTAEVSVLDMAASYLTFATRGTRVPPTVITRVTDADGRVLFEHRPRTDQVLAPEQADVITFCLRQVVESGTGTNARSGVPVAGKTGTTQKNGDAWFVGYTPKLSVAVWMGYPEGQARPMSNVHGIAVTGGTFPARIFRTFLRAVPEQYKGGSFPTPRRFPGEIVTSRLSYEDPDATTTTTEAPSTTTTEPEETTTTEPQETTTTTAPPSSSTTRPQGSTTTTAPSSTTTTTSPPPTIAADP